MYQLDDTFAASRFRHDIGSVAERENRIRNRHTALANR
jgi:hypothetical protein